MKYFKFTSDSQVHISAVFTIKRMLWSYTEQADLRITDGFVSKAVIDHVQSLRRQHPSSKITFNYIIA